MEADAGDVLKETGKPSFEIMYPRVRVKELEDPVPRQVAAGYLFRVIESLSLEDNGLTKSAVSDHISKDKIDSNKSYTRNPRLNSKDWLTPSASTLKEKSAKGCDEENISNTKADSVPRPRAVLSSPDNDDIIGNQNKRIQEWRRPTKGQASDNNRMINRHNPVTGKRTSSTQRSYMKTQANNSYSIHKTEIQKAFNLKSHIQPNTDNRDLKQSQMCRKTPLRANHSDAILQSSSDHKRSVFNEISASNGYPKIKGSDSDIKAKCTKKG